MTCRTCITPPRDGLTDTYVCTHMHNTDKTSPPLAHPPGHTRMMTMGTNLKRSAVVRVSCRRSLLVSVLPRMAFSARPDATRVSNASSLKPTWMKRCHRVGWMRQRA